MLYVTCTRLHPGHLGVRVGDSSRLTEIVKKNKSRLAPLNAMMMMMMMMMNNFIISVTITIIIIIIIIIIQYKRSVFNQTTIGTILRATTDALVRYGEGARYGPSRSPQRHLEQKLKQRLQISDCAQKPPKKRYAEARHIVEGQGWRNLGLYFVCLFACFFVFCFVFCVYLDVVVVPRISS